MNTANSAPPRRVVTSHAIAGLIFQALENERVLDLRYRAINLIADDDLSLPNYKVMKQIAVRNRIGNFYPVVIALAPWVLTLSSPIQWILALIGIVGRRVPISATESCRIFPTNPKAYQLIISALASDTSVCDLPTETMPSNLFRLGRLLGMRGVLQAICIHVLLSIRILQTNKHLRRDLVLHGRDAFGLAMMAVHAASSKEIFVTDDHYQRWSFLFSHMARDFRIVQHGFFDTAVEFKNPSGPVRTLYLRSPLFEAQFGRIYSIECVLYFSPKIEFQGGGASDAVVLLASSYPSIDLEIEFIRTLKAQVNVTVAVKFHPVHIYDIRKTHLSAIAEIMTEYEYPSCSVFISYESFMEFDYQNNGIPVVSISRAGGVIPAVQQTIDILNSIK